MIEPVVKDVWVPTSPEEAFKRFTDDLGAWWPKAVHSVSRDDCVDARFEGGRVVEESRDGTIHEWAQVKTWEPPSRLVLLWYPSRTPDQGGDVEVTFVAEGEGTRVRLVHTGWERLGAEAEEVRTGYDGGWVGVLELYRAYVG